MENKDHVIDNENIVVYGIYPSYASLELAVGEFKAAGFRNADISALLPSSESTKEFAHSQGTKAPEGAAAGAATGAVLGGTIGWLVGMGSVAIPGFGSLIAAGPILGSLAGAGVGGTVGGLTGALVGMGMPEYEAKRYEGRVKEGGLLLSVHCDNTDWKERALEILRMTGAQGVSATGEASADDPHNKGKPRPLAGNY